MSTDMIHVHDYSSLKSIKRRLTRLVVSFIRRWGNKTAVLIKIICEPLKKLVTTTEYRSRKPLVNPTYPPPLDIVAAFVWLRARVTIGRVCTTTNATLWIGEAKRHNLYAPKMHASSPGQALREPSRGIVTLLPTSSLLGVFLSLLGHAGPLKSKLMALYTIHTFSSAVNSFGSDVTLPHLVHRAQPKYSHRIVPKCRTLSWSFGFVLRGLVTLDIESPRKIFCLKRRKKKYMMDLGGKDHDACSGLCCFVLSSHYKVDEIDDQDEAEGFATTPLSLFDPCSFTRLCKTIKNS
ncbi:hypothetical protein KQX54_005034 [Cotesia glomerata]|uniref:Uncharacterized protein n=1 Tax=Cotesia glomerata TaxID=32391 RepID=A0AAV7J2E4_COTGL|nr:hypothetical protein KQX54_005034 [Cotesia glomerata]